MQGERRPLYAQRLNRDIAELFSHDFSCSSSSVIVMDLEQHQHHESHSSVTSSQSMIIKVIKICVKIFEGPYRGGSYIFRIDIPESYPFKVVDVFAEQPIWHPNIDLASGRVLLPIEWSPVITLNSLALAVQMIMLEPSPDNPMNIESYSYFVSNPDQFDSNVQKSIIGDCVLSGIQFRSVINNNSNINDLDDGRMELSNSVNVHESKQQQQQVIRNKRKMDVLANQWEDRYSMMITECSISDDQGKRPKF